jgi:hypothetical protein
MWNECGSECVKMNNIVLSSDYVHVIFTFPVNGS